MFKTQFRSQASVRPGIRPGFRSMSLTDAPTRRWPESQFRSLSVAQLPVRALLQRSGVLFPILFNNFVVVVPSR